MHSTVGKSEQPDIVRVITHSVVTPVGRIFLAATPDRLLRIELPGTNADMRMNVWLALRYPGAKIGRGVSPALRTAAAQLLEYFAGRRRAFDLPLLMTGTEFQRAVWKAVAAIPFATCASYKEVACRVDRPGAVRAVGGAQAANPLPIVVPCHRVVGSDGSLTGYGGGLGLKQWLLEHERVKGRQPRRRHLKLAGTRPAAKLIS